MSNERPIAQLQRLFDQCINSIIDDDECSRETAVERLTEDLAQDNLSRYAPENAYNELGQGIRRDVARERIAAWCGGNKWAIENAKAVGNWPK